MKLLGIKSDDTVDYKKTALLIAYPYCSGKCGEDCQNKEFWHNPKTIDVPIKNILDYYNSLETHKAVVMSGLEPFDSSDDLYSLMFALLENGKSVDIVIYTGYTEEEFKEKFEESFLKIVSIMKPTDNVILKLGRYDSTRNKSYFNEQLGVNLATYNQFTKKYSRHEDSIFIKREEVE